MRHSPIKRCRRSTSRATPFDQQATEAMMHHVIFNYPSCSGLTRKDEAMEETAGVCRAACGNDSLVPSDVRDLESYFEKLAMDLDCG